MSVPRFKRRMPAPMLLRVSVVAVLLFTLLGVVSAVGSAMAGSGAPPGGPSAETRELRLTVIGITETDLGMEATLELADLRPWWGSERASAGSFRLETDAGSFSETGSSSADGDPGHLASGETKRLRVMFADAEGAPLFLTYRADEGAGASLDVDISTVPVRGAWRQATDLRDRR